MRDKRLTEAMGECWHKWEGPKYYTPPIDETPKYYCTLCGIGTQGPKFKSNNFSTWEGFGKLWEWAQRQEWFVNWWIPKYAAEQTYLIHPDRFADAVDKFLQERQ